MNRWLRAAVLGSFLLAPPLAQAAPPPLEAYGRLPGMSHVSLSPSGRRYAFVADQGSGRKVYVMDKHGKLIETADASGLKLRDLTWAGDDFLLVKMSSTLNLGSIVSFWKGELSSVIVLNLRTHAGSTVFDGRRDVARAVFGDFGTANVDGRWYGYFGGLTVETVAGGHGERRFSNAPAIGDGHELVTDLYRVDLENGTTRIAAKGDVGVADWLVDEHGEVAARLLFDGKTGDWRAMTGKVDGRSIEAGQSKFGGVAILGFGASNQSILIRHDDGMGAVIDEASLAVGTASVVVDGESTDAVMKDNATGRWIGQITDGDEPGYHLFQPAFDARVRGARKALGGYATRLTAWNDDFTRMIIYTDGKDDSGTYWMVDIQDKSAIPVGYAYPMVKPDDVGPVKMIDWKAEDGLALRGVLTLPPGRAPTALPLVVMPHGGPWARDYPGFDYWAQAFASRGYAVFQPNFRGSNGYGAPLRDAGKGEIGRKMQTDVSDGIAQLARDGTVDPSRVCIVGASYGGYAALAGVTVQHGVYKCAVSLAGVSDFGRQMSKLYEGAGYDSPGGRYWRTFLGDRSRWSSISPAKLADRADAPILLIHGTDDTVVPTEQSDVMERALRAAGKTVERVTLKGDDHWLSQEDTRIAMIKASVAFVEKYNPPDATAAH